MLTSIVATKYNELSRDELFNILRLRQDVFVVEQGITLPDIDDDDLVATHVRMIFGSHLSAYDRIIPRDAQTVSIGRVCVDKHDRGNRFGKQLLRSTILIIRQRMPEVKFIKIEAQSYLIKFYESFGFIVTSEEYLEDKVPHNDMLLELE